MNHQQCQGSQSDGSHCWLEWLCERVHRGMAVAFGLGKTLALQCLSGGRPEFENSLSIACFRRFEPSPQSRDSEGAQAPSMTLRALIGDGQTFYETNNILMLTSIFIGIRTRISFVVLWWREKLNRATMAACCAEMINLAKQEF